MCTQPSTRRADDSGIRLKDEEFASALRSRHADTLDGRLVDLNNLSPALIEVVVSQGSACTYSGQHLAWQLVNLLGRLEGIIGKLQIRVEESLVSSRPSLELLPNIDPRRPNGGVLLGEALAEAARCAAPHRVVWTGNPYPSIYTPPSSGVRAVRVRIGAGDSADALDHYDLYASADGWTAYVGRTEGPDCAKETKLSFGAHVAAALTAAEIFRMLRARSELSSGPESLFFSSWSLRAVPGFGSAGPRPEAVIRLQEYGIGPVTLAGVGAVGNAYLLTLWAAGVPVTSLTAVDGDRISATNLLTLAEVMPRVVS